MQADQPITIIIESATVVALNEAIRQILLQATTSGSRFSTLVLPLNHALAAAEAFGKAVEGNVPPPTGP